MTEQTMRVYGCSDDSIEFEGEISGEVGFYGNDDESCLLIFSDGTVLSAKYGKAGQGIWGLVIINQGSLLNGISACFSSDDDPYSDVATFQSGLKWVYAAKEWELVK